MKIRTFSLADFYKTKYAQVLPYLKQKNAQAFTTIILTLIALSFFGIVAINPTLSTIANLQKQLEDSQFVDESLTRKITNLSILQRKLNEIQTDLPLIFTAVPTDPQVPMLASQLHLITLNAGLTVKNLQVSEVELSKITDAPNKHSSYTFALSASGAYDNILSLVSSLNNFERIVSIKTLAITQDGTLQDIMQVSIRGEAYFKK